MNRMMIFAAVASGLALLAWLVPSITLIVLGFRGRPRWASPSCAKCDYDLRGSQPEETAACPECGADLTTRKAVRFSRPSRLDRSWRLICIGVAALVLPVLGYGGVFAVQYFSIGALAGAGNPAALARASVSKVIADAQAEPDRPWAWQELERRLKAKKMNDQQVIDAVDVLIGFIRAERESQGSVHLSWQGEFINRVVSSGSLPEEKLLALAQAFYGPLKVTRVVPAGRNQEFRFEIDYQNHWDLGENVLVNHLLKISADGQEIEPKRVSHNSHNTSGTFVKPEGVDPLDVEFEFVRGLIASRDAVGVSTGMRVEDWPPPVVLWRETVSLRSSMAEEELAPLKAVTDPKRNPQTAISVPAVSVADLVALRSRDKVSLAGRMEARQGSTGLAISGDVVLVVDGKEHKAGRFAHHSTGNSTTSSGGHFQIRVDALDPSVKMVDLRIEPNPEYAKDFEGATEYWAEPIVIRSVPVRRLDLAEPVVVD